jgi:predicted small metal-binding protein
MVRRSFYTEDRRMLMSKIIDCNKVNPSSECHHVVRGETEEEVLENAKAHAKEHGFTEVTPELIAMIKANIEEEVKSA